MLEFAKKKKQLKGRKAVHTFLDFYILHSHVNYSLKTMRQWKPVLRSLNGTNFKDEPSSYFFIFGNLIIKAFIRIYHWSNAMLFLAFPWFYLVLENIMRRELYMLAWDL